MKKYVPFALILGGLICFFSCDDGNKNSSSKGEEAPVVITPATSVVKGALSDYFEVVSSECKISQKDDYYTIFTVELERTDTPYPFAEGDICYFSSDSDSDASYLGGFGYEILDEDGSVIEKEAASSSMAVYRSADVDEALRARPGETCTIRFRLNDLSGTPKYFRITSDLQPNKAAKNDTAEDLFDSDLEDIDEFFDTMNDAVGTMKNVMEMEKDALDMLNYVL